MEQARSRGTKLAVLLSVAAIVAAACGGGSTPSPSVAAAASTAPSTAASSGPSAATSAGASQPAASGGASMDAQAVLGPMGHIGGSVTVVGSWTGPEQDSFLAMVKPFEDATGVQVQYTGSRDLQTQLAAGVKSGVLPDMAGLPTPGQMQEFAQQGALQDLSGVLDMNAYKASVPSWAVDLGTVSGKVVGVFIKTAAKGLIWYNPKTTGDLTSSAPKTYNDLQSLAQQDKSKASAEWCTAVESGAASGWEGTDWIESLVLYSKGPSYYQQWYQGKVKWTDPGIKTAFQMFGDVVKNSYGGSTYVNATNFANGGDKLFASPPGCLFHHDANFITGLGAFANLKGGTDYNFFPFPAIDAQYANALEGAGDLFGMFKNTPQSAALMKWLVSAPAQDIWVKRGGALSANKNVPITDYPDALSQSLAKLITSSQQFVFDASDQMPAAMNDAFFKAIVNYIKNPDQLDSILSNLDQTQSSAYGG